MIPRQEHEKNQPCQRKTNVILFEIKRYQTDGYNIGNEVNPNLSEQFFVPVFKPEIYVFHKCEATIG